jgi:cytochrome c-type biogenesis protein CcmH/NrfF
MGLLLIGAVILAALQRRARQQPEVELGEQDSDRLNRLLADDD